MLKIIIKSSEVFMRKEAITRLKLKGKKLEPREVLVDSKKCEKNFDQSVR